jgi:hypothetical protein
MQSSSSKTKTKNRKPKRMKLSSISSHLSQSEAAVLATLAEKVQRSAEASRKRQRQSNSDYLDDSYYQMCGEAVEAAYVLRSIAEQSILDNDGELYTWLKRVRESEVCKQGWIDFDDENDDTTLAERIEAKVEEKGKE